MPRHTVTATTISLEHCNITVNNVDESFAFYSASLGLQVRDDVASGGFRWVTLGSDAQPGLGILPSVPHAGRSQADGDALQELLTKGVLPMLVFRSVPTTSTRPSRPCGRLAPRCSRSRSTSPKARATARSAIRRATPFGSPRRPPPDPAVAPREPGPGPHRRQGSSRMLEAGWIESDDADGHRGVGPALQMETR